MIFENIAERPLNITSVPNNFKSFIKQVYQKEWMQNINTKNCRMSNFQIVKFSYDISFLANLLLQKLYFRKKANFPYH